MWTDQLKGDSLSWLLQNADPGVRYLALRRVVGLPEGDAQLAAARREAHQSGPINLVLDKMHPEGYWVKPGPGYSPKYSSTVWSLILLAQLGARVEEDERIGAACAYLLEHSLAAPDKFSYNGAPGGTIDCLHGNLMAALLDLGCRDARLEPAVEWMARTVTGEGITSNKEREAEVRYYAYKCGPGFACGANGGLPCAWGGVKVLLALGKVPPAWRTPLVERAVNRGIEFFFSVDPLTAGYPTRLGEKPNRAWWHFGFPVFYVTDLLQLVEALFSVGCARDARLQNALDFIRSKQDEHGRWALENDYSGKTWGNFGEKKQPNPWVTLRALHVLRLWGEA